MDYLAQQGFSLFADDLRHNGEFRVVSPIPCGLTQLVGLRFEERHVVQENSNLRTLGMGSRVRAEEVALNAHSELILWLFKLSTRVCVIPGVKIRVASPLEMKAVWLYEDHGLPGSMDSYAVPTKRQPVQMTETAENGRWLEGPR